MPVQVPFAAVSATPSWAVPLRLGATVLTGWLARMTALAGEAACALPSPLVAVTTIRTCLPAEPAGGVYFVPVAPARSFQVRPPSTDTCHWYVEVIVARPVQVPLAAVSALPSWAVPLRLGATVLTGGLARMTALAGEAAWALPSPLVAVTTTRTCFPAEPAGGVYVVPVAPLMSAQVDPPFV